MRTIKIEIIIILALILLYSCKESNEKNNQLADFAITNVTLIDGTGKAPIKNATLHVQNGRISSIGNLDTKIIADTIIDGFGKYLIPGLFDSHFHMTSSFPKEEQLKLFLQFGVTSVLLPGSKSATYSELKPLDSLEKIGAIASPHLYYTSPITTKPDAHPIKGVSGADSINIHIYKSKGDASYIAKEAKKNGALGIKLVIEDGPTPPFVERISEDLIKKLYEEGEKLDLPLFTHVNDIIEVKMAVNNGARALMHSIMEPIDFEKDADIIDKIVSDSIYWVTTKMIVKASLYPYNPEWMETDHWKVFDPERTIELKKMAVDLKTNWSEIMKAYFKTDSLTLDVLKPTAKDMYELYKKGVQVVLGTDVNGTPFPYIKQGLSLHEEMQLMQLGGMPSVDIIKCASLNAAKMIAVDKDLGSLEVGKIADMILLDKNPVEDIANSLSINTVFKNGKKQPRRTYVYEKL